MKVLKFLLKFIVCIALLLCLLYYNLYQKRLIFYNNSHKVCFTVWKRWGGQCYIIPGAYYSLFTPTENYIKTWNGNGVTIIWGKDLKYHFAYCNRFGDNYATLHFNSIKVKYYTDIDKFEKDYYKDGKIKPGFGEMLIDIPDRWVSIDGEILHHNIF